MKVDPDPTSLYGTRNVVSFYEEGAYDENGLAVLESLTQITTNLQTGSTLCYGHAACNGRITLCYVPGSSFGGVRSTEAVGSGLECDVD